jgi:hypothetical protein
MRRASVSFFFGVLALASSACTEAQFLDGKSQITVPAAGATPEVVEQAIDARNVMCVRHGERRRQRGYKVAIRLAGGCVLRGVLDDEVSSLASDTDACSLPMKDGALLVHVVRAAVRTDGHLPYVIHPEIEVDGTTFESPPRQIRYRFVGVSRGHSSAAGDACSEIT